MEIEIDNKSGFCFGVVKAIKKAEDELEKGETLYCLGDIVHNGQEVARLEKLGLITINYEQFENLKNAKVLLRAHGEPPRTYQIARENNITLIDASCPVVLKLQERVRNAYQTSEDEDQIVIYGKKGHAEVNGLIGQTDDKAMVIENEQDLGKIDFSRKIKLFSQTTKSLDGFNHLVETISDKVTKKDNFEFSDTICRQVANRIPNITTFAQGNDVIIFVSGEKSSNGKVLFEHAKKINPESYMVYSAADVRNLKIDLTKKIGICGATSTPRWLMEEVAAEIKKIASEKAE